MNPYDFTAHTPPVVTESHLRARLERSRETRLCLLALLAGLLWALIPTALYFRFRDLYPQFALACLACTPAMLLGAALLAAAYFRQRRKSAWQISPCS